ncbi:uncharacterized protein TrAtP1_009752 [Trichoderma atroviride]|nr:hypothetical protein TrAtP1_009752 [Trichoderma atroviride]
MATPPVSRDEFEVALVCSLPLEYDAVSLLFDQFWDENGDRYGRAIGDPNTYTTGRFGNFDVVLVLLPNTGQVSAASATASLRSSYPGLRLVILTGICGAVPSSAAGDEILLGDVIISKTVVQYDYGTQYPDNFVAKDTTEDSLGRPDKNIRSLVAVLETARERERIEERAAVLLEQMQDLVAKKPRRRNADTYQYPGAASDKLFESEYRHKHRNSPQCLCEQSHKYWHPVCEKSRDLACDILGCDDKHVIRRQRLGITLQKGGSKGNRIPSVFIGRFGSSDKILSSGEHRDRIAKHYGILAFDTEGAGVWDELPCIIVKVACNYADSHTDNRWQNFAAATAASVSKSLVERYTKTDRSTIILIKEQFEKMMENKENSDCLKDLHQTDPRDDKTHIQRTKGDLFKDSYRWVLSHNDFKQWRDNPQYRLLWIKGDPGKGKTMLLCGIIDEIEKSTTMHCLSYFFCQATEVRLRTATAVLRGLIYMIITQRPLLISHVRERYDSSGKKLFNDANAWEALSKLLMAILNDPSLKDAILIVDALDECVEGLPLLLKFLSQASSSSRAKWIVSSRNWPLIEENLDTAMQGVRLCLELNETSVSAAVKAYIQHKVQELTEKKAYNTTTQHAVERHLTSNAHGTFLWVALVCQELGDPKVKKRHTLDKLKTSYPPGLDPLYQRMMENIRDSLDAEICRQILAIVSVVYRPITLAELSILVDSHDDYENDELPDVIGSCGSFLTIRDDVVYFIHQSAKDFLLDKASDQILAAGIGHQHHIIFSRSLKNLTKSLQRDVYKLRLPGFPIEQVSLPDPDPLASMTYSCIYWIDHFSDPECLKALNLESRHRSEKAILKFCERKYLYWLEALSLLRRISKGILAIQKLKEDVQTPQLAELLQDAHKFFLSNKRAIESAPLQAYAAALVFSPSQSRVRRLFITEEPEWILTKPHVETHWPASLNTLEGHTNEITQIAFSHDSSLIASSSWDKRIRLWRTNTGDCMQVLEGHKRPITSVAFSHDAELLASGSWDGTVRLWRVSTGDCLKILEGHTEKIHSIAFSFNSEFIASASIDGSIRLWDTDSGNHIHKLQLNGSPRAIIFSQDASLLASASRDGVIQLWHIKTGNCIREIKVDQRSIDSAVFSYDLSLLASVSRHGYSVNLWCIDTGKRVRKLKRATDYIHIMAFSQNSDLIASASDNGIIRIWRLDTGDCMRELKISGQIDGLCGAFSRDLSLIAVPQMWLAIRLWPTDADNDIQEQTSGADVTSIAFSPNSALVASASMENDEGTISLWCTETGRRIRDLRGHSKGIISIAFSHDSSLLASASADHTVRIWHTNTGECAQKLYHGRGLGEVAFSHDSVLVASASGREIRLWRTATGNRVQTLITGKLIGSIAFSQDSELMAIGLWDGDVYIKHVATGAHVQTLEGVDIVASVAFSPDSALVAAVAGREVRLWRIDTGECLQCIDVGARLQDLSITSVNSRILTNIGSIIFDSTDIAHTKIPAHFSGIGVRGDYSWITWNDNNVLRLPAKLGACHSAISRSTVTIGCESGRVIIIHFSTEELSKLYDCVEDSCIA